jgi:hypothetical protein
MTRINLVAFSFVPVPQLEAGFIRGVHAKSAVHHSELKEASHHLRQVNKYWRTLGKAQTDTAIAA